MRRERTKVAGVAGGLLALVTATPAAAQTGGSIWQELIGQSADAFTAALIDATVLVERGEPARAIEVCERAVTLAPERADGHACVLRSLYRARRHDELLARVEALRAEQPSVLTHPQVAHFPAMVLAERGEFAAAAEWLRAATRYRAVQTTTAIHYGNLGELYAAAGERATALLFFRQALAADADYQLARIGLAATLAREGDLGAARAELMRVLLADPTLSALETPGLFGVPDGELLLWRALLADVGGRPDESARLLAEFAATPSGAASSELLARLRSEDIVPIGQTTTFEVADCRPVNVAFTPDEGRLAVVCEGAGVQEGVVRDGRADLRPVASLQYETCCTWGSPLAGYVSDISYSPDGGALRLIYTDGQTEQVPVGGGAGPRTFTPLDNYEVRPVSFVGDGARIVVVSQMSSGAYVAPWGAPYATAQMLPATNGGWISQGRATPDARFIESLDGTSLSIFEIVSGRLEHRTTIQYAPSWTFGWYAALSTDAQRVVTARGPMLVLHNVNTQQAESFYTLENTAGSDPLSASVSFVEAVGPGRFVLGTQDRVHVFEATPP